MVVLIKRRIQRKALKGRIRFRKWVDLHLAKTRLMRSGTVEKLERDLEESLEKKDWRKVENIKKKYQNAYRSLRSLYAQDKKSWSKSQTTENHVQMMKTKQFLRNFRENFKGIENLIVMIKFYGKKGNKV